LHHCFFRCLRRENSGKARKPHDSRSARFGENHMFKNIISTHKYCCRKTASLTRRRTTRTDFANLLPKSNSEHNQALGENPRLEGLPLALSSGRLKT
jgi:hypothetical protein